MSGAGHNSSRAGKRRSRLDNVTSTPCGHVSFGEEKHQSLNSDYSSAKPDLTSLDRAASSSTRSRSSSLGRTLSNSAKRVFGPLRRLSTMSCHSTDRGSGGSNTVPSSRIPLLSEMSVNNNESNSPAVPISPTREPGSNSMQHNRISAHFDDTMARVLQLPILDGDESEEDNELVLDSGNEDELSLAITLALPGQLQLLGGFVGMYAEFEGRLGTKVAGTRHIGMVGLLDGVIDTIRGHVSYLTYIRKKKGQANAKRHSMEARAAGIIRLYDGGRPHLKAVLTEEVDMYNSTARKAWVTRKDYVLGQLLGGLIMELNELEENRTCKDEVRKVKGAWIESWTRYAAMTNQELVAAGWMKEKVV